VSVHLSVRLSLRTYSFLRPGLLKLIPLNPMRNFFTPSACSSLPPLSVRHKAEFPWRCRHCTVQRAASLLRLTWAQVKIQCVPLATEPGISLIILPLMRILQRNLKRTTDTFLFISHTKNVLPFKFRYTIFIGVRIIKEMPGSVASGTHCITRGQAVLTKVSTVSFNILFSSLKIHSFGSADWIAGLIIKIQVVQKLRAVWSQGMLAIMQDFFFQFDIQKCKG